MSRVTLEESLRRLGRYVVRNPYTGASSLDIGAVMDSRELRELLRDVWDAGYDAGFRDGDGDSYVETQAENPYKANRVN
jgi:hypothetical protein